MNYRLVAIARLPDGKVQILGGADVQYELDEDTAWEDLNAIIDDPDLPEPEPIEKVVAGVDEHHEAIEAIDGIVTEVYGPFVGKIVRNGAVGAINWVRKRMA